MWGGIKKKSSIRQIGVKSCRNGRRGLFCREPFKDSPLKKDDRKEGSSRLLVTVLVMMPFLNMASAGLSSEELNKVLC